MDGFNDALSARLRKLRGTSSQSAFARDCGLIPQNYIRYESGEVVPGIEPLAKITQHTNVTLDWLVLGKENHSLVSHEVSELDDADALKAYYSDMLEAKSDDIAAALRTIDRLSALQVDASEKIEKLEAENAVLRKQIEFSRQPKETRPLGNTPHGQQHGKNASPVPPGGAPLRKA